MSAIRKIGIEQKLIAVFLILSVLWGLLCGASSIILKDMRRSYSDLVNRLAAALIKTKEIQYPVSACFCPKLRPGCLYTEEKLAAMMELKDSINDLTKLAQELQQTSFQFKWQRT
ncbi:hypothetical protein [Ferviditalea candida]|uniref:Uncharacterized protein n=1 Tax=Ferviditalea candida TaxID=3108399 RepID=A0ABU5ZM22_9BACL|nr:hypothetical protein [Paenibacillaceae bacterium T2]